MLLPAFEEVPCSMRGWSAAGGRPAGKTEEEPEMGSPRGKGEIFFSKKGPLRLFSGFSSFRKRAGSIRRAFLWDIAFLHYFPQCAGEPVVFLGKRTAARNHVPSSSPQ